MTQKQRELAIQGYRDRGTIRGAAEAAGVHRKFIDREMAYSQRFRSEMMYAELDFLDSIHERMMAKGSPNYIGTAQKLLNPRFGGRQTQGRVTTTKQKPRSNVPRPNQ